MKAVIGIWVIIVCLFSGFDAQGQQRRFYKLDFTVEQGDTIQIIDFYPIVVFNRPALKTKKDYRQYERLIRAFRLTYPIALDAKQRMFEMEKQLLSLETEKEQKEYIKLSKKNSKTFTPLF